MIFSTIPTLYRLGLAHAYPLLNL